jgi:carbon starvation protein CstA
MFKNKFALYTIAFLTISTASALLYPAAQSDLTSIIWVLMGLVVAGTILTLTIK